MNFSIINSLLIVFSLVLVIAVLFRFLKLPVILGYIAVGAIVGPYALGWLPDITMISKFAEFGVVLLMFTIGLRFSLKEIWHLKLPVFALGGFQVVLTTIITMLIGLSFKMSLASALIVGGIAAMSSTAIVIKQLDNQEELHWQHGHNAVSVLLFQDLAVIPFIILISTLTGRTTESLFVVLGWGLLKGLIALGIILALGHWLFRPIFRLIAMTRAVELFTLTVLLVAIAAAALTHTLELSYALGAFLAGMMLAETEYRHQIEVETRPFRDILLGLFFVSIGMLLNIPSWAATWVWIVLLLVALLFGKSVLIFILSRALRNDIVTSIRTSLILAQGGEFGIVILFLALQTQLISSDYGQVILSALLLSMISSPFIIQYNKQITRFLLPKYYRQKYEKTKENITSVVSRLKNPVVIFGYGRVGQNIGAILKKEKIEHMIIDHNPRCVHQAKDNNEPVIYGDATHPEIIKTINLEKARAAIICLDKVNCTIQCLTQIRQITLSLPILVRSHEESDVERLQRYGATIVVPETTESSLVIAYHLLSILDIPDDNIQELIDQISRHNELLAKLVCC